MIRSRSVRRILWGLTVPCLVCLGSVPVAADLSGALLEVLQIGSRPDLGLGGDPFLSPAAGEMGWWRTPAERAVSVSSVQYAPVTRRLSGNRGELGSSETWLAVRDRRELAGWQLAGELDLSHRDRDQAWITEESDVRLAEQGMLASGWVYARTPLPNLQLKVGFPLSREATRSPRAPFAYGVRGVLGDRVALSGDWRLGNYGVPFDSEAAGELVRASINSEERRFETLARVRLWRGLAMEASYREFLYEPHSGLSDAFRDEFLPEAQLYLRQVSLEWRGSPVDLVLRSTSLDFYGLANGYWGGQRYLRLSSGRGALDGWLVSAQRRFGRDRIQADFETSDLSASGRADIEGWRFDDSNFVGGKKVAEGGGEGRLERYRIGYERSRAWGRLRGGVSWYEIRPTIDLASWTKIVFVRRDYEEYDVSSDRYSLAALSLGCSIEWRDVVFDLGLHQFVHFDDHLPASSDDPGGSGKEDLSGWYGGSYLEMAVVKRLGS